MLHQRGQRRLDIEWMLASETHEVGMARHPVVGRVNILCIDLQIIELFGVQRRWDILRDIARARCQPSTRVLQAWWVRRVGWCGPWNRFLPYFLS